MRIETGAPFWSEIRLVGAPVEGYLVATEVYAEHHDLEQVRALLGPRIETTQVYAHIKPHQLKEAVNFYESKASEVLS